MQIKNRLNQISASWWFLTAVILGYIILYFANLQSFNSSLSFFSSIMLKIIPIFIVVFIFMSVLNYFITKKFILKFSEKKGASKWFFIIIAGILSHGPIYMWYPLLSDLKEKGLSYGLIACFLYNRAIKIPILPLMVFYFSWKYVLVLMLVMVFMSVVQGVLIDRIIQKNENNMGKLTKNQRED